MMQAINAFRWDFIPALSEIVSKTAKSSVPREYATSLSSKVMALVSHKSETYADIGNCEHIYADPVNLVIQAGIASIKNAAAQKLSPGIKSEIRLEIDRSTGRISSSIRKNILSACVQTCVRLTTAQSRDDLDTLRPIILKFLEWMPYQDSYIQIVCKFAKAGFKSLQETYSDPREIAPQATFIVLQSYISIIDAMLSGNPKLIKKELDKTINQGFSPEKQALFYKDQTYDQFVASLLVKIWTPEKIAYVVESLIRLNNLVTLELDEEELAKGKESKTIKEFETLLATLESWIETNIEPWMKLKKAISLIAKQNHIAEKKRSLEKVLQPQSFSNPFNDLSESEEKPSSESESNSDDDPITCCGETPNDSVGPSAAPSQSGSQELQSPDENEISEEIEVAQKLLSMSFEELIKFKRPHKIAHHMQGEKTC